MGTRIDMHNLLMQFCDNVYFQPPENLKIKYPCIVYSLSNIQNNTANEIVYKQDKIYTVIVIDEDPDSEIADNISKLPKSRFSNFYTSDNLNHFGFTLYY